MSNIQISNSNSVILKDTANLNSQTKVKAAPAEESQKSVAISTDKAKIANNLSDSNVPREAIKFSAEEEAMAKQAKNEKVRNIIGGVTAIAGLTIGPGIMLASRSTKGALIGMGVTGALLVTHKAMMDGGKGAASGAIAFGGSALAVGAGAAAGFMVSKAMGSTAGLIVGAAISGGGVYLAAKSAKSLE